MAEEQVIPAFDDWILGCSTEFGGGHLETAKDLEAARKNEGELLLSECSEKFCVLIVMHGMLPSEAYTQAFIREDEYGVLVKPDSPAYQAKLLLRLPEIKQRIEEIRDEVVKWGKTSFEECEMNLRRIALNPNNKDSDRIAATKALSSMRGFDAVPEGLLAGATIQISMPWKVQDLSNSGRLAQQNVIDVEVSK